MLWYSECHRFTVIRIYSFTNSNADSEPVINHFTIGLGVADSNREPDAYNKSNSVTELYAESE